MMRLIVPGLMTVLSLCCVAASGDRAAIESVLERMEVAVRAADIPAYMAHVSTTDPEFLTEQEHWAADLKDHTPVAFDLRIVEDPEIGLPMAEFGDERATFELRTDWQMSDRSAPRSVSFPVLFTRDEASGAWRYAGESWTTVEDGINRVLCFGGFEKAAEMALGVLPEVREHVDELFANPLDTRQVVKIYPTMKHLQHSIYLSYVDGLSGWNEPDESIKILHSRRRSRNGMRMLLAHEYGHVATFVMGSKSTDIPWWALEGVAELCTVRYLRDKSRGNNRFMARAAGERELPAWEDLSDFRSVKPKNQPFVYAQGQHMIQFITDRHGDDGRNAWFRAMSQGATIDEATQQTLGQTFAELDQRYRDHAAMGSDEGS